MLDIGDVDLIGFPCQGIRDSLPASDCDKFGIRVKSSDNF